MSKRKLLIIEIICCLLIVLFLYASFIRQVIWAVPTIEIILVALLVFEVTRKVGLWATLFLLLLIVYTALILLHFFSYVPCGCGGVICNLTWPQQLVFNLLFAGITAVAIVVRRKEQMY